MPTGNAMRSIAGWPVVQEIERSDGFGRTGRGPMTNIVYVLHSQVNERYYIGSTSDLVRRLREHSFGMSRYTRFTRPFMGVYTEEHLSLADARKEEYRLKQLKSRKMLEQIIMRP